MEITTVPIGFPRVFVPPALKSIILLLSSIRIIILNEIVKYVISFPFIASNSSEHTIILFV